ncbi:MAG TPA: GNAT family N-acetyltransferase [Candidatus Limnocylindrales bacterium]|nr:GNAT family N-acetyltransferase [Candidatus Limnocylindrales bacterium]
MKGVTIRAAVIDDAAGIAHVHVESWRAAYKGIVPQDFLDAMSEERRTGQWTDILTARTYRNWVAVVDGRIVGFAGTAAPDANDAPDLASGALELATIYVLREAWDTGVGRALMNKVVGDCRGHGTPELVLWVFTANARARRFYERAGWLPDGAGRDLAVGGAQIPMMRYRLTLARGDKAST